jgi:hypothetical protein
MSACRTAIRNHISRAFAPPPPLHHQRQPCMSVTAIHHRSSWTAQKQFCAQRPLHTSAQSREQAKAMVQEGTDETFDQMVLKAKESLVLVDFYAE